MAAPGSKALTWRVSDIPQGTTEQEFRTYFDPKDRDRIDICSLCPDAYGGDTLTATVLFRPHREQPLLGPKLSFHKPPDMEIDRDFEGFTPLYCPPKGTHVAADIIAVTGLAGHAFGSWAHSEDKMWLRDYLPKYGARNARILTYGYRTHFMGESTSMATLGDLSNSFSDDLINMRDAAECDQRPIIFIGHSLGGLMIKKTMTSVRIRNVDSSRLPVRLLVFLAAPHRGMNIDVLRHLVKNKPPKRLIEELSPDSPTLKEMNEAFMEIAKDIDIITYFETQETRTLAWDAATNSYTRSGEAIMMLPEGSAKGYWPREKRIHANANHSDIAKLTKGAGSIFLSVAMEIKRALVPTAQSFKSFADPQNIEDAEWRHQGYDGYQKTRMQYTGVSGHPGGPQAPYRPMYNMGQSHSDRSSPQPGFHRPQYARHATSMSSHTTEGQSVHQPMEDSEVSTPEIDGSFRSTHMRGSSQSPPSGLWNPSIPQSHPHTADHGFPPHPHIRRAVTPEPVQFAQSGAPGAWSAQAQYSPTPRPPFQQHTTPPAPFQHYTPPGPSLFNGSQGDDRFPSPPFQTGTTCEPQVGENPAPDMQALNAYEAMRRILEQMGLDSDVAAQAPPQNDNLDDATAKPKDPDDQPQAFTSEPQDSATESDDGSEDLLSQTSGDTAARRHPGFSCDECDKTIMGPRYHCLECPEWDYCSQCWELAVHPKHDFETIGPPILDENDDFDDPGPSDSESDSDDETGGVAECANCHADVVSSDIFYQCPKCAVLEITCENCQAPNSLTCIYHEEDVQLRDFTWYGDELATNVWISNEPSSYDSALVHAVKSQDMDRLDALARPKQRLDSIDSNGRSPLHIAAHLRLHASARFLLSRGANPENRDRNSCTPLSQAILSAHEDMAFILLGMGANPNSLDKEGNTPLHLASIVGCINLTHHLAKSFPGQVEKRNKMGQTPLFRACQVGHFEIAQNLLDAGADPNTTNDSGATQLGELAALDDREAVNFLLNAGTEVDSQDEQSRTPLYRAAENDNFGLCNDLLQQGANPNIKAEGGISTTLGQAASYGYLKTVEALIEGGAYIEGKDNKNRSPLFRAAELQEDEVCRALLNRGASPNPGLALPDDLVEECDWHVTPLQIAAIYDAENIAEVLIEHRVLLEERDGQGRTALFLAAERGHLDVCKLLINAGADCDAHAGGSNAVSIAAQRGHFEMVQLLLQKGAKAVPPSSVKGQKWKNFEFDPQIMSGRRQDILGLLRAYKHR